MKAEWKVSTRFMTPESFSSGGRKVVRKCHVPSFCPNPLPGTTTFAVGAFLFVLVEHSQFEKFKERRRSNEKLRVRVAHPSVSQTYGTILMNA